MASGSGILEARVMNRSLHAPVAPGRTAGACVCLMAVLLLWTPVWASAWMARGMACCAGTMCATHGHGKTSAPGKSGATKSEMECEHPRSAGMTACSMSCCRDQSSSVVSNSVYVLPEPVVVSVPAETVGPAVAAEHNEVLQVFAPPSPPPKGCLV